LSVFFYFILETSIIDHAITVNYVDSHPNLVDSLILTF